MTLALLAALELTLRWIFPQTLVPEPLAGEHFSRLDPHLGLRYLPNAVWRFRHPEYVVDYAIASDGFRGPSPGAAAPAATPDASSLRVLLLGDSFTFGQGVAFEETWGAAAERQLREQGHRVRLINAGMQGMDTRSELLLLRELTTAYRPDVVVVGWLINDLYTNRPLESDSGVGAGTARADASAGVDSFIQAGPPQTFHLLQLARRWATGSDAVYERLYLAAPDRGGYFREPLPARPRRQLAVTERLLQQLAEACRAIGAPLVVVSIPQQFQALHRARHASGGDVDVALYDRHFSALARREGFAWLSTLGPLVASPTPVGDLYFRLDGHLTPAGHAIVGAAVAEVLGPIIEGSRHLPAGSSPR
jgi:lysophospholipase L1-like esterase